MFLEDGVVYNLDALIGQALVVLELDTRFGVQVEYWSNSMQTF